MLAKEIDLALRGTYVNNIYSTGGSQLVRFRKPGAEDVWLVVSPKKGAWISANVAERAETTEFTTRLRSVLERAKFSRASQFDFDRVFEIEFEDGEYRRLILELMPPGNIVVTDSEGKVLASEEEVRSSARRVVKGVKYQPPAQSRISPPDVSTQDVRAMFEEESTVGKAIGRHVALPRKYVAEALARLGVGESTPTSELAGKEEEAVRVLREMVAEARGAPRPCICQTSRGDEIFVIPPRGLEVKEAADRVSDLCDRLFLKEAQAAAPRVDPEEAKRLELQATASKLRAESGSLLAEAAKARSAASAARAARLSEAVKLLKESGVKTSREPTSSAAVASTLFDRAKELETRSAQSLEAAAKLEKKASKSVSKMVSSTRPLVRKKREWYEKFRWFFTGEGNLAIGGRDAQTNSALLSRHLDDNDTVYHADLFGSPFFVLKGGRGQSDEEVRELAQATVAFSSAWKTGLGSADAYWVSPDQVSASAPSGEYLPRGSFAIRGKKNFVNKNVVEVSVGVDSDGRVVAGPEEAVKRRSAHYLVLRPQREKGSDTAKRVLKDLGTFGGESPPPTLDDIQRALPTGGGKVVRRS
ncbi:MAG: NFACT family protein [Thaumarchaeota archaeon]|nr:NFACT family protein [Nitrososphaerota archaeon]